MGFKDNIRRLREQAGWTQAEAAKRADVPFRTLQNWEAGIREPRLDALKKLAKAYGVTTDEILGGEEAAPAAPAAKGGKGKRRSKK